MAQKAPIDMTDDELLQAIRGATSTTYYVADWRHELDRRQNDRRASESERLSRVAIAAAVFAGLAAAISAAAAWLRP